MEEYKSCGGFHFKLCYPELVGVGDGCNEWIQTSNPTTDSTITGFQPISITFQYDSYLKNWTGIGKDVSDYVPNESFNWTVIGGNQCYPISPIIPSSRNITSEVYVVKQVELYVNPKKGKGRPQKKSYK